MVRGIAVLVAATILLLFSMAIPWKPLFQVALGLYALAAVCLLWIGNGLLGITFTRPSPVRRGQVGQTLRDLFELDNLAPMPKLGLEIRDHSTLPGHKASVILNLLPRKRQQGTVDTQAELRGQFTLGPTGAAATDPFGLFTLERRVGPSSEVLIYPEVVDLGRFSVPGRIVTEGTRMRKPTQLQTLDPAGTRPYVYGDSQRRIHWLSSAHVGQLMVKEFEFTPAADVWIFLDLERAVHVGSGIQSTEEYAVTAAASVAGHYLASGRAVGLLGSGRREVAVASDRGHGQLIRILEELAVVRANGRVPLAEMLSAERQRLGKQSTAVVISPSVDERWASVLAQIQHWGTSCAAMLVEAATFGRAPASTMQVAGLTSAGVPTYLIKRSTSIHDGIQEGLLVVGPGVIE